MEPDARQPLTRLIRWNSPLEGLIGAATRCDRLDGPAVLLNRPAVREVLRRCIAGEVEVRELPRWAGTVHMMEHVEIADADVEVLTQFLFEVSTPELFEQITTSVCQRWVDRLVRVDEFGED